METEIAPQSSTFRRVEDGGLPMLLSVVESPEGINELLSKCVRVKPTQNIPSASPEVHMELEFRQCIYNPPLSPQPN